MLRAICGMDMEIVDVDMDVGIAIDVEVWDDEGYEVLGTLLDEYGVDMLVEGWFGTLAPFWIKNSKHLLESDFRNQSNKSMELTSCINYVIS